VDLYYVEANDAAKRMLGQDFAGKRLTEISPSYERYWFDIFGEDLSSHYFYLPT
jgi:hypothetical protein